MSSYFAILGIQRSGSQLLETSLAQFPDIACYGEIFNKGHPKNEDNPRLLGWTREQRNSDPVGFLEKLIVATPGKIPGFRVLMHSHMLRMRRAVLADARCTRFILRRDPVESFVSLKLARTTRQWVVQRPDDRISAKVHFDVSECETYLERVKRFYDRVERRMRNAGTTAWEIDYAALTSPETIYDVARKIGAKSLPSQLSQRTMRQNPGPIESNLENPEDFRAWRAARHHQV